MVEGKLDSLTIVTMPEKELGNEKYRLDLKEKEAYALQASRTDA